MKNEEDEWKHDTRRVWNNQWVMCQYWFISNWIIIVIGLHRLEYDEFNIVNEA